MGWVYNVNTRAFYHDGSYQFSAKYSGRPGYKNDSSKECVKGQGPIPRGSYRIGEPFRHHKTGSWTMRLKPSMLNHMCDRDGFMIHGDSLRHPGEASDGCIILGLQFRKKIAESGDDLLVVQ